MTQPRSPGRKSPKTVTIFGGSGFVGRYLVRALAERGYTIRVAVRRPDLAGHLQPMGNVGQIKAVQANLRYPDSVKAAVAGSDVVVNLVAILAETGRQTFDSVNVFGAKVVAEAAKNEGARLIHGSAIGADRTSESGYGSSRGEGEEAVVAVDRSSILMRSSIIFGQEDQFFNRFAAMARLSPALPLIGGGHTKFQLVYVGDVAEAYARAVDGDLEAGKTYELGGSEIYSFRQCLELMCDMIDRKRLLVSIPWSIAKAMAKLTGWLPGAPITYDQVLMLESDNVVSAEAIRNKRTLEGMGIQSKTVAAILPTYLTQYRPHGQYVQRDA